MSGASDDDRSPEEVAAARSASIKTFRAAAALANLRAAQQPPGFAIAALELARLARDLNVMADNIQAIVDRAVVG